MMMTMKINSKIHEVSHITSHFEITNIRTA